MGGQPKNTTSTQKVEPWDGAKPYYETLYGAAQNAFNNTNRSPYTGQLYAGPTATQQNALDMFRTAAGGMGMGADPTRQLAQDTISGKYLYADSNPYLQGAVDAAVNPIQQRLQRSILPSIQDQSIAQGAFGGSGNGVQNALATSDFTQQALDIASRMYDANYQRERALQMQAPALFAAADQMALSPAQALGMAGQQEQTWQQAALDAELQRYNINQAAPWSGLGEWAQILNGGGFSSVGQTQSMPGGGAASWLQGGAGAAATLASLFGGGGGGGGGGSAPAWAQWLNSGAPW